jgi:hypothetical protein
MTWTTTITSFSGAGIIVLTARTKKDHTGDKGKQSYFLGILHHHGFIQGFLQGLNVLN